MVSNYILHFHYLRMLYTYVYLCICTSISSMYTYVSVRLFLSSIYVYMYCDCKVCWFLVFTKFHKIGTTAENYCYMVYMYVHAQLFKAKVETLKSATTPPTSNGTQGIWHGTLNGLHEALPTLWIVCTKLKVWLACFAWNSMHGQHLFIL